MHDHAATAARNKAPVTSAIIVAAGRGRRFGSENKVLAMLWGRPLLAWSLDALGRSEKIAEIVLVAGDHTLTAARRIVSEASLEKPVTVVRGGLRRQDSVHAGLAACAERSDFAAIHDAARPLVTMEAIDRCVQLAWHTGAAILATPVADTLKQVQGSVVQTTVPRDGLWSAQTPQVFDVSRLLDAFQVAERDRLTVTDEAMLFELMGWPVSIVQGSASNIKVTSTDDLHLAEALSSPAGSLSSSRRVNLRTGIGYDAHRFNDSRKLILGGVEIADCPGLEGHSDADVLLHAICDAMLGAAGLGDIGTHFPPSKAEFLNVSSLVLLERVNQLLSEAGWVVGNIDATVIAEWPRVAPHARMMQERIAASLEIGAAAISVKATTNEGMGFIGRREGIAALANATIVPAFPELAN